MMKLVQKIQKNKLYLTNNEIIDITPDIKRIYRLKEGDDISAIYHEIIQEAAFAKALFLLSLHDRTKDELQKKLIEKYANQSDILIVLDKIEKFGYINDVEYAINYIQLSKYGKNRIRYNLMSKGISSNDISIAYDNLSQIIVEEDIEDKKLKKAIEKNKKKEKKKLIEYLIRQGFSLNKIMEQLSDMKQEDDIESEEL